MIEDFLTHHKRGCPENQGRPCICGLHKARKELRAIRATGNLYARALVPSYVPQSHWSGRVAEYTPLIIAHFDSGALENEQLDRLWEEFDCDEFDEFLEVLQDQGYTVFHAETPGVWTPETKHDPS
jgi:hypothetical protein